MIKKIGRLLQIVVLFVLCDNCTSSQEAATGSNLTYRLSYDNMPVQLGKDKMYLLGDYFFEESYVLKAFSAAKRDRKTGAITPVPGSSVKYSETIDKYILTDIKRKICIVFTVSDSPEISNHFPITEKKKTGGFLFKPEIYPEIKNESKNFHHLKDTVIDNRQFNILEDTVGTRINNMYYQKIKIYQMADSKNFPMHIISTSLDNLFNGLSTRIDLVDIQNKVLTCEIVLSQLDQDKRIFIEKYIALYDKWRAKHNAELSIQ